VEEGVSTGVSVGVSVEIEVVVVGTETPSRSKTSER
jgi:hypothetical protein